MIVYFDLAWPTNIHNSVRTGSIEGKSLLFLLVVVLAYVFGILHKLIYSRDGVIYFYVLNVCMVLADVVLYVKNRHREVEQGIAISYNQMMM